MDTDESFEKWFDDKWKKKLEGFPRLEKIRLRNIAKDAWMESRAAVEVNLPEQSGCRKDDTQISRGGNQ